VKKSDFQAVYKRYGAQAIASVLGVPAPTVRRWAGKGKSAGIPASRVKELETLGMIARQEGYEEKALREMMREAQKAGKLPKPKTYIKRRDGEKTTGVESSKKFQGFLNEAMLLEIREHLEKVPLARSLPNWLASVQMSALDSDGKVYVKDRFQTDHAEADDFIVDALQSSGLQHSRKAAIDSTIAKLRKNMLSGGRYYVHGESFSTYQYKTEHESKERAREQRRARRIATYKRTGK